MHSILSQIKEKRYYSLRAGYFNTKFYPFMINLIEVSIARSLH